MTTTVCSFVCFFSVMMKSSTIDYVDEYNTMNNNPNISKYIRLHTTLGKFYSV
jgi:hypothetical protein